MFRLSAGRLVFFTARSGSLSLFAQFSPKSVCSSSKSKAHVLARSLSTTPIRLWKPLSEEEKLDISANCTIHQIRNFAIIAHVDHGKSTLSDRLLEEAGNISSTDRENSPQSLDQLKVERERGITVKAQTATMFYRPNTQIFAAPEGSNPSTYILNLIDTPGHVDFSYEVSRSLAACQGALLLVDASQGIQAQTLANYRLAKEAKLDVIPVLTKTDLPHAEPELIAEQMESAFGFDALDIIACSAKAGTGLDTLFPSIVRSISPPPPVHSALATAADQTAMSALLFDSWFDVHRGVICLINVTSGRIGVGDIIGSYHGEGAYEVQEIGLVTPMRLETKELRSGQVGYVICGIRTTREVRLGDTFYHLRELDALQGKAGGGTKASARSISKAEQHRKRKETTPLPGFQPSKSMVFAGLFPAQSSDFESLREAIERLTLNDASVEVQTESSDSLGLGFRCGFLGLLHMDVFQERLEQEFNASVIITAPTVSYKMLGPRDQTGLAKETIMTAPSQFPKPSMGKVKPEFQEPMVKATILSPESCVGPLMELCEKSRGTNIQLDYLDKSTASLVYRLPLASIISNFYEQIKSLSSGYASVEYEEDGYDLADLTVLTIQLNGDPVDALSTICIKSQAQEIGRQYVRKLKTTIDRANFEIKIQASLGAEGKVIASERLAPYRKDVLMKGGKLVGGGDESRKKKLLEKQKEGKKRMKTVGSVQLSQDAFLSILER